MTKKTSIRFILPCVTLLAAAMAQVHAAETAGVTGEITPKLYYFNYSDGPGAGLTEYLQGYDGRESWSGDSRDGFYGDLDLDLAIGDSLVLDRRGFGLDNHRGKARADAGGVAFTGYYSHYRSNIGGVDYLYNPNRLPADNNGVGGTDPSYNVPANSNSGYFAQFNDDAGGQTEYKTDRTSYGLGMKLKPGLLGGWSSIAINFDGYRRDGNEFATWVAGGSDLTGAPLSRWRGYDKPVDEKMGRVSFNLTASPKGLFTFAYDGSLEKFDNQAGHFTMDTLLPALVNAGTGKSLHFVPDSTLASHAVRLTKTFDSTVVAAGYGMSRLEQDSFTAWQTARSFTTGKIGTENAYLNINHRVSPGVDVEGHIKYYNRDNDSTYPAVGLIDAAGGTEALGVRIDNIESLTYGLSATFRGLPVKSTLSAGWKREDSDRDLTFNNTGIIPTVSLYRDKTDLDEVYLKWVARPMKGMTLRLTPSYVWADKTALVTVPEDAFNLKAQLGYAMADGKHVNAYYNYKRKENGNNGFTDKTVTLAAVTQNQNVDSTFHSAGVSLNLAAMEKLSASVGLDWTQSDFETYYFSSNYRRYDLANDAMAFLMRGLSNYKVDTWSLSFNGDYQASDRLKLSGAYTYSRSNGDGVTVDASQAPDYTVREAIDDSLHSLILGAGYTLNKGTTLRASYVFDKYDDDAYGALSGNVHTLMLGMSFKL